VEATLSSTSNFDVDKEFVEEGCFLMYTNIRRLRNQSYKVLQLNARTLDIDPTVIHEMRWNPTENRFEGLNIHYPKDVIVIDPRQCSGISPKDFQDRRKVKENHMKYRKLRPGNRLSSVSSPTRPMMSSFETSLPDIPVLFRGRSNESGECLWAAAALLIHSMDQFAGISMMHYYNNNPDCFEWLSMYTGRGTKRTSNLPVETGGKTECGLSSLLTINTDFNLHKIRGQNGAVGNLEYVKQVGSGYFVCNLKDQNGSVGHCIGIWKKSPLIGLIYDCRESHVLPFSKDNIDRCCGPLSTCISIPHMGEIRYKRGKGKQI
jgi:hypothetical protein